MWTDAARAHGRAPVATVCAGCGSAIMRASHTMWREHYCEPCAYKRWRALDNARKRAKWAAKRRGLTITNENNARQSAGRVVRDPGPDPLAAGMPLSELDIRGMLHMGTFSDGTEIMYCGQPFRVTGAAGIPQKLETCE